MGLIDKIKIILNRTFNSSKIDYTSEEKIFGNEAEESVAQYIKDQIPNAKVKTNILLNYENEKGEIDCLVVIDNKVFIVEIKHWFGIIEEKDNIFTSTKYDKYTGEKYVKEVKSPFSQVKKQVYLLKSMTKSRLWVNSIVLFVDSDKVIINSDNVWFDDLDDFIDYLKNDGKTSYPSEISKCLLNIKEADFICSKSLWGERSLHCIIDNESLRFNTNKGYFNRKDIRLITINHHLSYDDLSIELKNGDIVPSKNETASINVFENDCWSKYSLSKIDIIKLGNN